MASKATYLGKRWAAGRMNHQQSQFTDRRLK